uniref:Uncharacterized protein n=1 Tax=Quercus lobata TaxID=97700 RepID=A0A7N2MKQ5_QUELO
MFHQKVEDSKKNGECPEKSNDVASLRCAFELFDANFFNDKKGHMYLFVHYICFTLTYSDLRRIYLKMSAGIASRSGGLMKFLWPRLQPIDVQSAALWGVAHHHCSLDRSEYENGETQSERILPRIYQSHSQNSLTTA